MTIDQQIDRYIHLRDKIASAKKRFDEAISGSKAEMTGIEMSLLKSLQDNGLQNFKGQHATAFIATRTSLKAADWDVFLKFVQENDLWHMLTRAPGKTACVEYLEETGSLPPGLEMDTSLTVQLRKSK